jgi:hypothetical protein
MTKGLELIFVLEFEVSSLLFHLQLLPDLYLSARVRSGRFARGQMDGDS